MPNFENIFWDKSAFVDTTDEYSARAVVSLKFLSSSPDDVDSNGGVCISSVVQTLQIGTLLLIWINSVPSMNKELRQLHIWVGITYSFRKIERCIHSCLGKEE